MRELSLIPTSKDEASALIMYAKADVCLAGLEELEIVDADNFNAEVRIRMSFKMDLQLTSMPNLGAV